MGPGIIRPILPLTKEKHIKRIVAETLFKTDTVKVFLRWEIRNVFCQKRIYSMPGTIIVELFTASC